MRAAAAGQGKGCRHSNAGRTGSGTAVQDVLLAKGEGGARVGELCAEMKLTPDRGSGSAQQHASRRQGRAANKHPRWHALGIIQLLTHPCACPCCCCRRVSSTSVSSSGWAQTAPCLAVRLVGAAPSPATSQQQTCSRRSASTGPAAAARHTTSSQQVRGHQRLLVK